MHKDLSDEGRQLAMTWARALVGVFAARDESLGLLREAILPMIDKAAEELEAQDGEA